MNQSAAGTRIITESLRSRHTSSKFFLLSQPMIYDRVFNFDLNMKIVETVVLLSRGEFAESQEWKDIRQSVHDAIKEAEWPVGKGKFIIHPESGKKSGQGNGVVPIKAKPMQLLREDGWKLEYPWLVLDKADEEETESIVPVKSKRKRAKGSRPGNIDAAKSFPEGLVVVEWETGNVSSSHRAINKMALGLVMKQCIAGILVLPNMKLAQYLTDRIGNIEEIRPYAPLWGNLGTEEGVLEIVVIQQDDESIDVPKIPKGKDGRAAEGMLATLLEAR